MMSSCWQVSFHPEENLPNGFENFLDEYFEVNACNYQDEGPDEYVGYKSGEFREEDMLSFAQKLGIKLPPYQITFLESSNWLKDYVIKFSPFTTEDFMIYGIHETKAPQTDKIPLQIYAATAFGSDHQTTHSCLQAISDLYHQGFVPCSILDIGTGSGILSLASAKLWQDSCKILAVDIDEEAVWVTRQNAENNNLSTLIQAEMSDGFNNPLIKQKAPYDLILANILARPLIEMSFSISNHLKTKGYVILSGFVEDQENWVIQSFEKTGMKLIKLYKQDNWRAALMQKE